MKGIKKRPDKKAIFANFPFDYKPMQSVLNNLRWVRNVCAHNGRLWNKRTPFVFVPIKDIDSRLIKSSSNSNELDSKIYNTIIAMAKYINPKSMGFPDNWEVLPEWKNPSPLPRHVIAKKEKRNKRRSKRK